MTLTQQVRIKLVHVTALLPADVAFPRVRVRMTPLVQKIQSLIREADPAKYALQPAERPLTCRPPHRRVRRLLGPGRRDRAVGRRRVLGRRALGVLVRRRGAPPGGRRAARHDLPLEVLAQQALQRRDLDQRAQAAGRRRLQLHAARGGRGEGGGAVALAHVVGLLAGLLLYGDQGDGGGYVGLVVDSERVRLDVAARGGVRVGVGGVGGAGTFAVYAVFRGLGRLEGGVLLVVLEENGFVLNF